MDIEIINALKWCFLGLLYSMPALFIIAGCVTIYRDNVKK